MTAVRELADAVTDATYVFRKGEEVEVDTTGPIPVVTFNGYPEKPDGVQAVDVHFLWVIGQEGRSPTTLRGMLDAALDHAEGVFNRVDVDRMRGGPSYIELGGWLGSQDLALRLIGLGHLLGWWQVITPAVLGFEGSDADAMAGQGLVLTSGLTTEAEGVAP